MFDWILDTASSPAFWKAAIGFATAGGLVFSPEQTNAIVAAGLALMGIVHAFEHVHRS